MSSLDRILIALLPVIERVIEPIIVRTIAQFFDRWEKSEAFRRRSLEILALQRTAITPEERRRVAQNWRSHLRSES